MAPTITDGGQFRSPEHLPFSRCSGQLFNRKPQPFQGPFQVPGDGVGNEYSSRMEILANMLQGFFRPQLGLVDGGKCIEIQYIETFWRVELHDAAWENLQQATVEHRLRSLQAVYIPG